MRLGGDRWAITTFTDANVNFCTWVLLKDGLRVPPFDKHQAGDEGLRAVGLTASGWREWFEKTVRGAVRRQQSDEESQADWQMDLAGLFYKNEPPTPEQIAIVRRRLLERSAAGQWQGRGDVRERLLACWFAYGQHFRDIEQEGFNTQVARWRALERLPRDEAERVAESARTFWDEIQQYRQLPPVYLLLVEYPVPVVDLIPPSAAVLGGVQPSDEDSQEHRVLVRQALMRLREGANQT